MMHDSVVRMLMAPAYSESAPKSWAIVVMDVAVGPAAARKVMNRIVSASGDMIDARLRMPV